MDFVTSTISTTSLFLITSVFPSFRSLLSLRSLRSFCSLRSSNYVALESLGKAQMRKRAWVCLALADATEGGSAEGSELTIDTNKAPQNTLTVDSFLHVVRYLPSAKSPLRGGNTAVTFLTPSFGLIVAILKI
jgi:hypothetical protein